MSLMGSLYTGVSGLQTSSNALNTTAHNMSNLDTKGYTRQQVQQGTRNMPDTPIKTGYRQVLVSNIPEQDRKEMRYWTETTAANRGGRLFMIFRRRRWKR